MGRRSFGISVSEINRIISASNAAKKAQERERLINSQNGTVREQKPQYSITSFDFNEQSRVSHIEFLEETKYRKIARYVTQNGQRYPIYSGWLTRTKKIKKTIRLTNENLENLKYNEDGLISKYAYEIVASISNDDYYPSWFIIDTLCLKRKKEIDDIVSIYNKKLSSNKLEILRLKEKIEIINETESKLKSELNVCVVKRDRLNKSIEGARNRNHIIIFSIITCGVYAIFHSKAYIKHLERKLNVLANHIEGLSKDISISEENKNIETKNISDIQKAINDDTYKKNSDIDQLKKEYDDKIAEVDYLPISLTSALEDDFISLKKLSGMNYEKIIGCYVIKNVENNKCYVGQSKDIMKRVCKQHFDGVKVKNIIFAEDYYSSKLENKDDIFVVKIIRLTTKDELDRKEKELIEEYDSFKTGYNRTAGNI